MNSDHDYGKEAYYRLSELERRLSALESAAATAATYISVDLGFTAYLKGNAEKTLKFYAVGEQKIKIAMTSVPQGATVYLNGTMVVDLGGDAEVAALVSSGENSLRFVFASSAGEWISVGVTVSGFLDNRLIARRLCAMGGKYYCYSDGDTFYVYKRGTTDPIVSLYGVSYAYATYNGAYGIFVCTIAGGTLTVRRYNTLGAEIFSTVGSGVYKKCLVRVNGGDVMLYGVRGSYLWIGTIDQNGVISEARTGLRAEDISFRTVNASDWLLVTDINGVSGLCLLSQDGASIENRYTVGRVSSPKISYGDGNVAVWYTRGGAVCESLLQNSAFSPAGAVLSADEAIILDDGAIIARNGAQLSEI